MKTRSLSFWFALGVFTIGTVTSVTARAHAKLTSSVPVADSVIHVAPTFVVLRFSEELEVSMSKAEVKNSGSGEIVSQGEISNDGNDKASIKVGLKSLPNAKSHFEVSWKAVAKDSHKMPGHFKFTFDPLK